MSSVSNDAGGGLRHLRDLRHVCAGLLLGACTGGGDPARAPRDSAAAPGTTAAAPVRGGCASPRSAASLRGDTTVTEILLSPGNRGMVTRVRWAASPDGCAMLAVEDPVGIEADPIPNRFVYVAEPRAEAGVPLVMAQDSVWDVAPDPAWRRLAFGRAFVVVGRGGDTLAAEDWRRLARSAEVGERDVRAAAFPSSGMTIAFTVARAVVADVSEGTPAVAGAGTTRVLPVLAGWRVRWSADGRQLLLGVRAAGGSDDAPAAPWRRADASTGAAIDSVAALPADVASVAWSADVTLDVGAPIPLDSPRTVRVAGGRVESRGGRISLVFADGTRRDVGAGAALASTAGGRFVLALRARGGPVREGEVPHEVVIYQLHY